MARTARDVTDAELAVLEALWQREPATIRQITDRLYPDGQTAHYATVQKLLERLEGKGYVRRDRSQSVHVFVSALDRGDLIGQKLRSLAEQLCGGSLTPLLTNLVQSSRLSARDRRALRQLIDELEQRPRRRGEAR
jgi:predicted transcriptional regulator